MASPLPSAVVEHKDGLLSPQPAGRATAVEQTSGFFRLSAELRNMIYDQVIEPYDEFWVCTTRGHKLEDGTLAPIALAPPVTQICRLTREESLPMVFGKAIVSITLTREENVERAKRWAAAMGDEGLEHVKRLRLHGKASPYGYQRVCIEKQRGSDFSVFHEKLAMVHVVSDAGMVAQIEALGRNVSRGRKPLSCYEDFDALIDLFASRLAFRQQVPDDE